MQTVCDILKMISQLEVIKPERKGIINYVLAAIMGETPRVTEPYSFPDPFPAWANIVKDRVAELMLHEVPLDDVTTPTLPAAPLVDSKKRKRSTPNASHSGQHSTLDINDPEVRKAMYNITRGGGSERKTIKIADPSKTLDYNVWGNNGLQIGAWYPYRLNALQAGAHGSAQGGIAGGAQEGAKSIVVGGMIHHFFSLDASTIANPKTDQEDTTKKTRIRETSSTFPEPPAIPTRAPPSPTRTREWRRSRTRPKPCSSP